MSAGPAVLRAAVVPDVRAVEAEWRALDASSTNLFTTYEWQSLWTRHQTAGRPVTIGFRRDRELVGLLPLHRSSRFGLRLLRLGGHGPGDRLGLACAPVHRAELARHVRSAVAGLAGWDVFLGETLPLGEPEAGSLPGRSLKVEACPEIRGFGGRWEDYLQARSRNFRSQVRRRTRSLLDKDDVGVRLATPATFEADLDALLRLHRLRWGGITPFLRDEAFHRAFARRALALGWLRLWTLERDGVPTASLLGYRFGGAEWFYQSGRDPELSADHVGFVLLAHSIRTALEDGMTTYHLLRGDEDYKQRFATHDDGLTTLIAGRTSLGQAAVTAARGAVRMPRRLRHVVLHPRG